MILLNEALVIVVASGATLLGLLIASPIRPSQKPVSKLRKITAFWLWAYAFVVLFLQFLKPPNSQTIALLAIAGVFWLLDGVVYSNQVARRETDERV